MNISLSDALVDRLRKQAVQHGFTSIDRYIEVLLDCDLMQVDQENLDALILDGLASGGEVESSPEFWDKQRRAFLENHPEAAEYL